MNECPWPQRVADNCVFLDKETMVLKQQGG
jgi:hypothetical protein